MVNIDTKQKRTPMQYTTSKHAHPFFVIDLSRNFEIDPDELRSFVKAMPNWKFVEMEGTAFDGTDVDVMLLWGNTETKAPRCAYDIQALAEFINMAGFDISQNDIAVDYTYAAFTCACCNFAPVLPLDALSHIKGIYGNVDNQEHYVQKAMCRANLARQTIR